MSKENPNKKEVLEMVKHIPNGNHQRTRTNAHGFVRIVGPNEPCGFQTKERQFFGLLAPGNSPRDGALMARALVPATNCPEWFKDFIAKLEDTETYIRVALIAISEKAPLSFFIPKANNLKQLLLESKRVREDMLNQTKYEINEYPDDISLANFIYDEYAKKHGGLVVDRMNSPGGPTAYVIKTTGEILHLSGGDAVWNFTDGIVAKNTTLEKEMDLAVKVKRVRYL